MIGAQSPPKFFSFGRGVAVDGVTAKLIAERHDFVEGDDVHRIGFPGCWPDVLNQRLSKDRARLPPSPVDSAGYDILRIGEIIAGRPGKLFRALSRNAAKLAR